MRSYSPVPCSVCALLVALFVWPAGATADPAVVEDTFSGPTQHWTRLEAVDGTGLITAPDTGKNRGEQALLREALPMPSADQRLTLSLTVRGMTDIEGGEVDASARIFLVPGTAEGFIEPYAEPHTLWLYISWEKGEPQHLTLFAKNGQQAFGTRLYQARLTAADLPLHITWEFGPETYRLECEPELTGTGARTGRHGLDLAAWGDKLRFGMRAVNHRQGVRARLSVDDVRLVLGGGQAPPPAPAVISPASLGEPLPELTVTVDPAFTCSVNGVAEVPRIFGVTTNGWTRGEAVDLVRAINPNSARSFLWMLNSWQRPPADFVEAPVTPGVVQQYGRKGGLEPEAAREQYARFWQQDFRPLMEQWWQEYGDGGQALQVDLFERWGLNDGLVFHPGAPPDDALAADDPEGVRNFFGAYLDTLHRHHPDLDIDFIQLSNEPNYSHFTWSANSQRAASEAWLRIFNDLDSYLRQDYPRTRLLGPCLAGGTMFFWGGWQDWTAPVIAGATHPLTHFNYHCYETPAYTHLAWMEMLQAHADALGRPRPRAVITEMNHLLHRDTPAAHRERVRWWAQQLFTGLANPDKMDIWNYFLLAYRPMAASNLLARRDGEWEPNDTYWLYWTLAELRGRRVRVDTVSDRRLRVAASAPAPDRVVAAVFNDSDRPRPVTLSLATAAAPVRSRFVRYVDEENPIMHGEEQLDAATALLAPGEVRSFAWSLPAPVEPRGTLPQLTFYSPVTATRFTRDLAVDIPVDRLPEDADTTWLRLGIATDDLLAARGLDVVLNGQTRAVYWNQAPAQLQTSQRTVWWLEIPLAENVVQRANRLLLAHPDAAYRLMFAGLVYRRHTSPAAAAEVRSAALERWNGQAQAGVKPLGALMSGDRQPLSLVISNPGNRERTYSVTVEPPDGLVVQEDAWQQQVTVPAGGSQALETTVEAAPVATQIETELTVRIVADDLAERTLSEPVVLYPRRQLTAPPAAFTLDGSPDEWTGAPFASMNEAGLDAAAWMAWDADNLYLAARVAGPFTPEGPPDVGNFWGKDCLEIFLDLGNQKSRQYDDDDLQVFANPVGVGGGPAFGGVVQRRRRGDTVDVVGIVAEPRIRVAALTGADGYSLEAVIPWAVVDTDFAPTPGMRIGLNLALNHPASPGTKAWMNSLLGLGAKHHTEPNKWPVVILE